jgi:hypothetical protein
MTRVATAAIVLSLAAISAAQGQTKVDGEAIHNLPQAFAAAFNKHDGHQLAQIMADDTDFVTVGATWITSPMPMPDQVGPQPSNP